MVAGILLRCLPQRLKIPREVSAAAQRLEHHEARLLAGEDLFSNAGNIESLLDFAAERLCSRPMIGKSSQIAAFVGIGSKIEKLIRVGWRVDEFPAAAPQHVHRRDNTLCQIFAPGGRMCILPRTTKERKKTATIHLARQRGVAVIGEIGEG